MNETPSELSHQFGVSVAVVHILEWLKRAGWFPWLTQNSTTVLRLISILVAAGTSAGFKIVSGDWQHGVTLFIPPLSVLVDVVIHTVAQYGAQHGYYNLAVKSDGVLQTILKYMQQDTQGPKTA